MIAGFALQEELSRGGFGAVWRARAPDGPLAAVKLLEPLTSAEGAARFLREVEALRSVAHPGVVRVLGAGLDGSQPWLAMELVEGESLDQRLRRSGPLPPLEAARIARDLADALAAVHSARIAHRDVKPANVLLRPDGRVVLVDFGLSLPTLEHERLTRTGIALGTPAFMAPEQIRGARELGPAVDVYAAGATLYALLTGEPPYGAGDLLTLVARSTVPPRPPSALAPEVPPALDALVLRCLAERPEDRPPTSHVLRAELDRFLRQGRRPARRGIL